MNNIMSSQPTENESVITVSLPLSEWQVIHASLAIASATAQVTADADEEADYFRAPYTRRTADFAKLANIRLGMALTTGCWRAEVSTDELYPSAELAERITDEAFTDINDRYEEAEYKRIYSHSVKFDEAVPF